MEKYDVVIVGGGPGGYVAAIRGSQLGLKVALVEKDSLGGVCLNWGCIPTKVLLRNAEVISLLHAGSTFGFEFDTHSLKIDYSTAQQRSREVSRKLVQGIEFLMKKNKVAVYSGTACLKDARHVSIQPGGEIIEGKNIILATGSRPNMIPGVDATKDAILTSRKALEITEIPPQMIVVGAGAIGMEFASIWRSYGAEVTVVEARPTVLPLEDKDIGLEVQTQFEKSGIKVLTQTLVEKVEMIDGGVALTVRRSGRDETLRGNKVLISIGIRPNSENLGLEQVGVQTERGYIKVDDYMRTSVPGIYAIGDITGKLPLAHVASAQGIQVVEHLAGKEAPPVDYARVPRCTYCRPETASVGLTEEQALEQGYRVKCGIFPFRANGKALALGDDEGFVKVVAEAGYGEILGVHMVGPHVTEMVAGPTGFIGLEGTAEELARTIHPHPTLSEVITEAAHAVGGKAIHI